MKIGQRVIVANDEVGQAWGIAGEMGTVIGPDPKGFNMSVVSIRLDRIRMSICEMRGIDVSHLIKVE